MKKIIPFIIIIIAALIYYFKSSSDQSKLQSQKIQDNKVKIAFEKKSNEAIINNEQGSKEVKKTAESLNVLKQQYSPLIQELSSCLKVDFCGMKKEANDPFFDPSKTDGMKQLKKTLTSLLSQQKNNTTQIIKDKFLLELFELPSEEVQELSLKILIQNKVDEELLDKILEYSLKIVGSGKSHFYSLLQKQLISPELNQKMLMAMNEELAKADGLTVISISENLHELNLTEKQWSDALTPLCKVKAEDESNWLAIRYHFNKYAKDKSFAGDSDSFCP